MYQAWKKKNKYAGNKEEKWLQGTWSEDTIVMQMHSTRST